MNDEIIPKVDAPTPAAPDVPTVARGGGAPITEDTELQEAQIAPEGALTVDHTATARAVEQGMSPYGGLDPQRADRSTLDNSPQDDVVDNHY